MTEIYNISNGGKRKKSIVGIFIVICIFIIAINGMLYSYKIIYNYKVNSKKTEAFSNNKYPYTISLRCNHSKKEKMAAFRVGNEHFKVHEDLHNYEDAAKLMSKLNITAKTLIAHLNDKYAYNSKYYNMINPLYKNRVIDGINDLTINYQTPNLEENIPERSGGDTSYVIDKGDTFAMCLRSPENNNNLEDNYNDLTFVLIHEMAHLFTKTYGHDFMFWSNFKFLLEEAILINIYQPINYKTDNSPYCGIKITYSPLYDKDLPNYLNIESL